MSYLILVRHGKSEWNEKGLWTGFTDIPLSESGRNEAKKTAAAIKGLPIDLVYTSPLSRAKETLSIIMNALGQSAPVKENFALNERDYGIYTGKNKWEVKEQVGSDEFKKIRRSFAHPIPKGESLKMVYERVIPYFEKEILPQLKAEKNVLVSAHGNSIRALVKYLEGVSDEKIADVEIQTGEAWVYKMARNGKVISKEIRAENLERI
ncbi:MAG: 2,3-bisphosphoglycerate-dependent phosphoglycerate mutase [Parcubacteria group bacterium GW2011_GWA2_47_21]|nr:MAG: 2,3-bisphosphoglycerate-dependent phosphoglycerate mutase [Parcubacteria group bacterium GW2011_GWA2_47_21]